MKTLYLCEHCNNPVPEPAYAALERLALWFKAKEIEALEKAGSFRGDEQYAYWSGKADGFANAWAHIVFQGRDVSSGISPQDYNNKNEYWSEKAQEVEL